MRRSLAIAFALLLPALAQAEQPYVPKFARVEQRAELLDFGLFCTKPEYPKASLRNEEQGRTTIRLTVAPTGRVSAAIEKSSGFRDLDNATLRAMQSCFLRPASINGAPVQDVVKLQYVWTLQ